MISYWWFTLVLFICLLILFNVLCVKFNYDDDELCGCITALIIIYLIVSFVFWVHSTQISIVENPSELKIEKNIKTIHSDVHSETNGKIGGNILFAYGSLKTDNGIEYITMVGTDSDGYKVKRLKASETYIFFNEDDNPRYVEFIKIKTIRPRGNWLFGGVFKFEPKETVVKEKSRIELHLPSNAVEVNYNIDLK